jgi:NTE family protein
VTKTALILGGGGVLGVSWETGVLNALQQAGVDVTGADLLVGTSAGSIVATQVAQGHELAYMLEEHRNGDAATRVPLDFDLANLTAIFAKWAAYPDMTQEACAEIGRMAIASKTAKEEDWVASFAESIQPEWPRRDLRLCAVDAESGEFRVWTRDSGVDMRRAVASSCAVPGLLPCVRVDGRLYQDGGVRSGTSADLATGYNNVLILAPIGAGQNLIDPLLGRITRREAEALRTHGANVELAFPDERAMGIMAANRMDATKRGVTAEAGVEQGRGLAKRVEAAWSTAPA